MTNVQAYVVTHNGRHSTSSQSYPEASGDSAAWQREMERAQLTDWFCPPILATSVAPVVVQRPISVEQQPGADPCESSAALQLPPDLPVAGPQADLREGLASFDPDEGITGNAKFADFGGVTSAITQSNQTIESSNSETLSTRDSWLAKELPHSRAAVSSQATLRIPCESDSTTPVAPSGSPRAIERIGTSPLVTTHPLVPIAGLSGALQYGSGSSDSESALLHFARSNVETKNRPEEWPEITALPAGSSQSYLTAPIDDEAGISLSIPAQQTYRVLRVSVSLASIATHEIRSYAEWTPEGVAVWLGMNGDASEIEQQVSLIVTQLRRTLLEQGHRLNMVVCNGRIVFENLSHDRVFDSSLSGSKRNRSANKASQVLIDFYQQETS